MRKRSHGWVWGLACVACTAGRGQPRPVELALAEEASFRQRPPPPGADGHHQTLPASEPVELGHGLGLVVVERHDFPLVSLALALPEVLPDRHELALLTLEGLCAGTRLNGGDTALAPWVSGKEPEVRSSASGAIVSIDTVPAAWVEAMDVLARYVRYPLFNPATLGEARRRTLRRVREGALSSLVSRVGLRGVTARFQQARREQLVEVHRRYFRPERAALVVVGDVKTADVVERARGLWSDWSSEEPLPEAPPSAEEERVGPARPQIRVVDTLGREPWVSLFERAPAASSQDFPAFTLLVEVLHKRSLDSLRREAQVAYMADAAVDARRDRPSVLELRARVDARAVAESVRRLGAEIERVRTTPLRPDELEQAKAQNQTSLALSLSSEHGGALLLASWHLRSLPTPEQWLGRMREVQATDVTRVAGRYLSDTAFSVLILGRLGSAELAELRSIGEVTSD